MKSPLHVFLLDIGILTAALGLSLPLAELADGVLQTVRKVRRDR